MLNRRTLEQGTEKGRIEGRGKKNEKKIFSFLSVSGGAEDTLGCRDHSGSF